MCRLGVVCLGFLYACCALALPLTPEQVPAPLKLWIPWVLHDQPERLCPFKYDNYGEKRCNWPSTLHLDLHNTQGHFTSTWQVYQESWLTLPGDGQQWPHNVLCNQQTVPVMEHDNVPAIKLAAGSYQISGDFYWDSLPDNLSLPEATGLVTLHINDRAVELPILKEGQVWLKGDDAQTINPVANAQASIQVQVFRKVIDDVPLQILTHLDLDISGQARELKLPMSMLPGFAGLAVDSPLPARLETDGQLILQARPGHWTVEILSRALSAQPTLSFTSPENNYWPESEIWAFEARPDIRLVEVQQLSAVDTSQTNMPQIWRNLPAYIVNPGQKMVLQVLRRGDPDPKPNQLNLNRTLWLDFAGTGYTVNDTISGSMTHDWRLTALTEMQLGKVQIDDTPQLITQDAQQQAGVEVRRGDLHLTADSRISVPITQLSAVGWQQDFQHVQAQLNLPPGWRLLAVSGVDNVPDTWLARWTLLDLFEVLVAALAIARLWSWRWGGLALLTLILIWHEPNAPHFVWLHILAACALLRVVPVGRFLAIVSGYRYAGYLGLVLLGIPFMVQQVRTGFYPQLEYPWQSIVSNAQQADSTITNMAQAQALPPAAAPAPAEEAMLLRKALPNKLRSAAPYTETIQATTDNTHFRQVDPQAKVQTGPGLPQWQWRSVQLSWNGAVTAQQRLQLWYLSPPQTLWLNLLSVALFAILALFLIRQGNPLQGLRLKQSLPVLWGILLLPVLCTVPRSGYAADFPDAALLETLKTKLLEAPDCIPQCAQLAAMQLNVTNQQVSINLSLQAQQAVAVPLPADYGQWFPQQVQVDGQRALALFREQNTLWLALPPGSHQILLQGRTPLLESFTLPLPLKPHRVTFSSNTWQIVGIHENGQAQGPLQLNRIIQVSNAPNNQAFSNQNNRLPPFVRVERTLQLGVDWQVNTEVTRLSPDDSAIVLNIPLLSREAVTTPGIRIKEDMAEVNMAPGQRSLVWQSTLPKTPQILLQAASNEHWVEIWRAEISPVWHPEFQGIALLHQDSRARWLPEWHPWPGESVTLKLSRPEAFGGQNITIDSSELALSAGQRSQNVYLNLQLKSSQGGQHTLLLPEGAMLQNVNLEGRSLAVRAEGRKVTLPLNPGSQHFSVHWQQTTGIGHLLRTPVVDLGQASVNTSLKVHLGTDRWVLLTLGPAFGPAVLFWGLLIVIVLLALVLSQSKRTPLTTGQWSLLLLGLSQIPLLAALLVVSWLLLLSWRATRLTPEHRYFNACQVLLGLLTLIALGLLFQAVAQGLLHAPDMQIVGNNSTAAHLQWYQDRSLAQLPQATVVSVPLLVYRLCMLAWSLWLAFALLHWLKWGWQCYTTHGFWYKKPLSVKNNTQDIMD